MRTSARLERLISTAAQRVGRAHAVAGGAVAPRAPRRRVIRHIPRATGDVANVCSRHAREADQPKAAGRPRRGLGDRVADAQGSDGLRSARPQPGLRHDRGHRGSATSGAGEDDHVPDQDSRRPPTVDASSWPPTAATRAGPGSQSALIATTVDLLFVLVGDGRRWFIPAAAVEGGNAVQLGGPKYSRVRDRARRADHRARLRLGDPPLESGRPGERRSWRAEPDCKIRGSA